MWKECWIFSKSGLGVILCSLYLPFIHTVPYHKFVSSVINSSLLILICIARLATQDTFARYRLKYNLSLRIYLWWTFYTVLFTRVAGESYLRRFRSLFCLCDVFRALITSLCVLVYSGALGLKYSSLTKNGTKNKTQSTGTPPPLPRGGRLGQSATSESNYQTAFIYK